MVIKRPWIVKGEGEGKAEALDPGVEETGMVSWGARGHTMIAAFPGPLDGVSRLDGNEERRKESLPLRSDLDVDGRRHRGSAKNEAENSQSRGVKDAFFWFRRCLHNVWDLPWINRTDFHRLSGRCPYFLTKLDRKVPFYVR